MPMPVPNPDESRDTFVARCLGHATMMADFPEQDQRLAVCYQQYRSKGATMADLEIKVLGPMVVKDEAKGEVEAVFATLNVVDLDEDVVTNGAIPEGTKGSLSSYGHDAVFGEAPVGKGIFLTVDNKAVFRGRYFLSTTRGREAFNTAKEMGPDQQWSFAFRVLASETPDEGWRAKGARRILTKLDAFEASPVLRGAGIGTRTVAVKAADQPAPTAAELEAVRLAAEAAAETKRVADEAAAAAAAEVARVAEAAEVTRLADAAEATRVAQAQAAAAELATKEYEKFLDTQARERARRSEAQRAADAAETKQLADAATEEFQRFQLTRRWLGA